MASDDFFDAKPGAQRGARPLQVAPDPPVLKEALPPGVDAAATTGDPLLQSIAWITRHHGRPRSPESLRASGAIEGALRPDQALRLLREGGYNAGLIAKAISDINPLLLPAVLLLGKGDAWVLARRLER